MKNRIIGLVLLAITMIGCNATKKISSEIDSYDSLATSKEKVSTNMENPKTEFTAKELKHLERCVVLAEEALKAGDQPFGSILVDQKNEVISSARNRVNEINVLAHPEIELANWAVENLSETERKNTTMYTSGEHCPMCAAAHGWVGLGKIVYLSSAAQLGNWLEEINAKPSPINFIPIEKIIKDITVKGPGNGELLQRIKKLQLEYYKNN